MLRGCGLKKRGVGYSGTVCNSINLVSLKCFIVLRRSYTYRPFWPKLPKKLRLTHLEQFNVPQNPCRDSGAPGIPGNAPELLLFTYYPHLQ